VRDNAQQRRRQHTLDERLRQVEQGTGKLDAQDEGQTSRGRQLSGSGATARIYHAGCEAHLARIIPVDLQPERFAYALNESALALAQQIGKRLLVPNTPDLTLRAGG
jgi:hypothetical protein